VIAVFIAMYAIVAAASWVGFSVRMYRRSRESFSHVEGFAEQWAWLDVATAGVFALIWPLSLPVYGLSFALARWA
jgi:hypothetical protein